MGHEVSDRYYKLGSSVDITCQVALSFLNTIPSPPTTANERLPPPPITKAPPTTTTTAVFPFLDPNLIKKTFEQHIPYIGKHNIKWKKDGKDLPKDIKINLRFVWPRVIKFRFFHEAADRLARAFDCQLWFHLFILLILTRPHQQHNSHLAKQQNFDYTCWESSQWHLFLLRR